MENFITEDTGFIPVQKIPEFLYHFYRALVVVSSYYSHVTRCARHAPGISNWRNPWVHKWEVIFLEEVW